MTSRIVVGGLAALVIGLALPIQAMQMGPDELHLNLINALKQNCSGAADRDQEDNHVELNFDVDDRGRILNTKITSYAKNQQRTAEVLEAFNSFPPLKLEHFNKGEVIHARAGIEPFQRNPAFDGSEVKKFRELHHLDENRFVIIHKLPLSLLASHEGMFSASELRTVENLIAIPIGENIPPPFNDPKTGEPSITGAYVAPIIGFYQRWNSVLAKPNPTKKFVLREEKKITAILRAQGGKDFPPPP